MDTQQFFDENKLLLTKEENKTFCPDSNTLLILLISFSLPTKYDES